MFQAREAARSPKTQPQAYSPQTCPVILQCPPCPCRRLRVCVRHAAPRPYQRAGLQGRLAGLHFISLLACGSLQAIWTLCLREAWGGRCGGQRERIGSGGSSGGWSENLVYVLGAEAGSQATGYSLRATAHRLQPMGYSLRATAYRLTGDRRPPLPHMQ